MNMTDDETPETTVTGRMAARIDTLARRLPWATWLGFARREIILLLCVLVGAMAVFAFVEIAGEVIEGDTRAVDRAVLMALRQAGDPAHPLGPPWVQEMARDVTALGSITVLLLVSAAVAGFLLMVRKRAAAVLVIASVLSGMAVSTLLKALFERSRPDLVPHATQVFTASFPSGHAMLSAVTYLTLGALLMRVAPLPRVKIYALSVAVLLTLLIGASRLYLGVHWPTDVLAGWCVGAAWAIACWLVALLWWRPRRAATLRETEASRAEPTR